ncbi:MULTISPECIES: hypothetical protein [unclassified Rhodococcus (in: high G+C Gram-positive bacteria)]|uniref:hypothetical protein n=1 Tax=unclassified Rhodococcus (in: high G+C Gram-positive bacteria) TaxID=192944 RepID=UPI00163A080B|nr:MULTISPECIES: hypothetical protein [unclassified Rhodococcus (in: high G+C Gram-positive bacteria)]MBC2639745.1 hypothetical protein [Rhodococcus sp. 3A]MBC2895510.1 hypothetical protein [Rhodococcus sp. 4CII]
MHGQLAGHLGAGGGVGGVLCQFGEEPVAVAGAGQVRFGRGILAQARRRRTPREESRFPQRGGAERIG